MRKMIFYIKNMSDYEEDLMKRIDKESNGAFEEIFKAIYSDQREEGERVDQAAAQKDANVNLKFEFMCEFRVIKGFFRIWKRRWTTSKRTFSGCCCFTRSATGTASRYF